MWFGSVCLIKKTKRCYNHHHPFEIRITVPRAIRLLHGALLQSLGKQSSDFSLSPSSSSSSVCLSPPLSVHSREDGMSRRGVRTTLNHCRQVTAQSPRPSPRQSPVPKTNPAVSVFPAAASPQSFHAGHAACRTHTLIGQRPVLTATDLS